MNTFKIITIIAISSLAIGLGGCKGKKPIFLGDNGNYVNEQEQKPLKFPAGSLPVSNRYDIPSIPNDKSQVINEITPPDY